MKNILEVGNRSKKRIYEGTKLFERKDTRFICYFWSTSMLLVPDPPNPEEANHYGSM